QRELPAARIREMHEVAEGRMQGLFERGQREGFFRADLPVSWMLAVTHLAMNAAAAEVTAGRIARKDAAELIIGTLLPAFSATKRRRRHCECCSRLPLLPGRNPGRARLLRHQGPEGWAS